MNRKSFGEDFYSPIRCDVSLNESTNADDSFSVFCGGSYNAGSKKDNRRSLEPIKDEELGEMQNNETVGLFKTTGSSTANLHLPIQKLESTSLSSDNNFETALPQPKSPRKENQSSLSMKPSNKTTRTNRRSSRPKTLQDKFVTIRRDSGRSSSNHEPMSLDQGHLNLSRSKEDLSSRILEEGGSTSVDGASQTDMTLTDLQDLINKVDLKTASENAASVLLGNSGAAGKLPQFQSDSLESLRDSMNEQFHGIRQLLYLQQMAISKVLYQIQDETESTNTNVKIVAEGLNSIISLLTNGQFRNNSLPRQFNS